MGKQHFHFLLYTSKMYYKDFPKQKETIKNAYSFTHTPIFTKQIRLYFHRIYFRFLFFFSSLSNTLKWLDIDTLEKSFEVILWTRFNGLCSYLNFVHEPDMKYVNDALILSHANQSSIFFPYYIYSTGKTNYIIWWSKSQIFFF